ncbi:MAG: hypothetical protein Q9162_003685 [Coniocarpon cinnabarinum]
MATKHDIAASEPMADAAASFPRTREEMDQDDRVFYSDEQEKWMLDDDGPEYEWEEATKTWILANEESKEQKDPQDTDPTQPLSKKRKLESEASSPLQITVGSNSSKKAKKAIQEKQNTAVYVTSIPLDADVDEIKSVFGKYGLIAEAIDSSRPRIKMYKDKNGRFTGEALVVYFRPESISLAIQMLDDSDFRPGVTGPGGSMRVSEADPNFKKVQDGPTEVKKDDQDDELKLRKKAPSRSNKQVKAKTTSMNSKLADWSSDEDVSGLPQTSNRYERLVVLKHMFSIAQLEDDSAALDEIRDDIHEEAEKLGQVLKVTIFDKEPLGVATVSFNDPRAAQECVKVMNGRRFDGRTVLAGIADGSEKFKKTSGRAAKAEQTEKEGETEGQRIDEFGDWLEEDE